MNRPTSAILAAWARHLGDEPSEIDAEALRARLVSGSLPDLLRHAAEHRSERTIAVDDVALTYAELHERVGREAAVLVDTGLVPGDRVVISAASSLGLVSAYLATLHAGLTAVLTNPKYTAAELAGVIRRSEARLVLADPATGDRADDVPTLGLADLAERSRHRSVLPARLLRDTDVALLAFTSGTTGEPKRVPLTHGHLLSSIRSAMRAWRWSDSDVLVHALPLFHQHGLSGIHASLAGGTSAAILSRFDAETLLGAVEDTAATILFGVPAIHRRLLEQSADTLAPLRRLRLVTSGSGPLPPSLAERFREATGVELLERYGLTETGLNVSNPYEGRRKAGRVGIPLPGVEVQLTGSDGRPVPDGDDGEIVVRGPQVFDGYLDDEDATAAAFLPGGWFRTGDLGRWDEDGYLRITGRLKDLVITGGMNVSPMEVEAVVEQLPEVAEAAVAGLPSEEWGEEVAVWVVPTPGERPEPDQVITHCRSRLASYKCPKKVFTAESLPRNAMGKLVRTALTPHEGTDDVVG